jgi:hypothetical protein
MPFNRGLILLALAMAATATRAAAAPAAAPSPSPLLARCESAIKQTSGQANQTSVGACLQCAASLPPSKNVAAVVEGCIACSSSRDPARCGACLSGAAPNFCAATAADDESDDTDDNSSRGCISKGDATVCKTCTDASQGAALDQCSAAAARSPFSPDVAACAALPSPERRAGCYACAATAATTAGGCADCASLPGDMDTTAKPSALRRRHLASQQPVTLEPAAASVSGPTAAPNGTTSIPSAARGRATTAVDAPPLATTASPARDCAACLADQGLNGNEAARSWCFACASRHKDDPTARTACFACLRRPLDELTAEAERAQQEGGQAGGAARRGRGGAAPSWGDLC